MAGPGWGAGVDAAEAAARIEVALYSSGQPMKVEELVRASGTGSRKRTLEILDGLVRGARRAFCALEIAVLPDGRYVFQVKPEHSAKAKRHATRPLLANAAQTTLSYVAWKQPVSTKELLDARGSGVYAHLAELRKLGFLSRERVGSNITMYKTTEKFQKYFGVEDDDALKRMLHARVKRTANRGSGGPPGGAPGGAPGGEAAPDAEPAAEPPPEPAAAPGAL